MSQVLLLAAILAAQGAARASVPDVPRAPQTDWPPFSLFTDDDYPAAAMRNDEQGMTRYRVEIGADGRVSGCTIRSSSGSAALDAATCRIVRSRARFAPARDRAGRPVPDAREGEVTWRMESDE